MLSKTSLSSSQVDFSFYIITGLCIALLLLITFLMIYFTVRYEKKRHPVAVPILENRGLEMAWTVIPIILVLCMFYYGSEEFAKIRKIPQGAIPVTVIGRQWEWLFVYENKKESRVLVVPVRTPILLHLHSQDVVHSFYVPAFKIKEDAVPRLNTYLWFEAREKGTFDALCSEYCGLGHAKMISQIVVVEKNVFEKWLASKSVESPGLASPGYDLVRRKGCINCHTTDGSALVGPSFRGLLGKRLKAKEATGEEVVDEAFIRKALEAHEKDSLASPASIIPPLGARLTEKEKGEIVKYIKELK